MRNYLLLLFTAYALAAFGQRPLEDLQDILDENLSEGLSPIYLLLDDNILLNAQAFPFVTWRAENPAPALNQELGAGFESFLGAAGAYYANQIQKKWWDLSPMERYALRVFMEDGIAYCRDFSLAREEQHLANLAQLGALPNYANYYAERPGYDFSGTGRGLFVRYGPEDFYGGNIKHPKPYFARQRFRRLHAFIYRRVKAGVPIENMQRLLEGLNRLLPSLREGKYEHYDQEGRLQEEGEIRNGKPYGHCRHYAYLYGEPDVPTLIMDWQTDKKGRLEKLYFTGPDLQEDLRHYLQYKKGKLQAYQVKLPDIEVSSYYQMDSLSMDLRKKKVQLFRQNRKTAYTLDFRRAPKRCHQSVWELEKLQEDIVLDLRLCDQEDICFPAEELSYADKVVALYIAPQSPAEFVEKWQPLLQQFTRLKKVYLYLEKEEDWGLYSELLDQGIQWELY